MIGKKIAREYKLKGRRKFKESDVFRVIDRKKFYEEHTKAIKDCDAVIAEVSRPTITVGYQLFYAIANKKPILALCSSKFQSQDLDSIKSIINTESQFITLRKYNIKALHYIMANFLKKKIEINKKFNFIINKEIDDYIAWLQLKSPDKSKSEALRDKIIDELILNDSEYNDYLNKAK